MGFRDSPPVTLPYACSFILRRMEISESKLFASLTTFGLIASFAGLPIIESNWPESPSAEPWVLGLTVCGLTAVFLAIFIAVVDAFALGQRKWAIACLLVWPCAFIFIWLSVFGYFHGGEKADC